MCRLSSALSPGIKAEKRHRMGSISAGDMANSWLMYPLFRLLISIIYIVSHIYDYLTYPIWYVYQKPWRVRQHR